ncbi:MAG: cytochrome c oxidase assembly protein [Pseudoxanthomonas suwonensis]|nr:cytochrome c oxidase assembly protein [Pseudoxanthomonas suwonensis]
MDWSGSYCGDAPLLQTLWSHWMFDPVLWTVVAGCVAWVASRQAVPARKVAGVLAGVLFAIAFASPLCAAGVALFSARTLHHWWIVAVCAPLFVLGMPQAWRRAADPLVAAALFIIVLLAWHVPALYDASLRHVGLYWLMQLALLGVSVHWWNVMSGIGAGEGAAIGRRLLGLGATALPMGLLAALLTFSTRPWFDSHLLTSAGFGLSALDDQRLGGMLMWLLGMLPVFVAMAIVSRRQWLQLSGLPLRERP